ncbi:MAG: hypothetical protein UT36_C0009G0029 [Candidatus Peregrinibacteria bacterium GW2011_GWF2_39_17]|nr:MAG: hypothetical protein UT36_C0009G0029 [Candidatus Peregrinibacteria bacterium GW2011_GWF2_39_17]HCW32727.1 hypothetical protein [Candidatus Peregrinibacteria bacterium]
MENKFKKGLILGGLLTAAAVLGFAMSHEGQELTEELQKDLKNLAKQLKKSLHKLEDITKEGFDESVATVVEEYAKKKELASDAKKALINALQSKWHEMEEEYLAEKDEVGTKK